MSAVSLPVDTGGVLGYEIAGTQPDRISKFRSFIQDVKPKIVWCWKVVVETFKTEGITITLLFISALGLLPVWMCIGIAVCGIARLCFVIFQGRERIEKCGRKYKELEGENGRFRVENLDLTGERDRMRVAKEDLERALRLAHHDREIAVVKAGDELNQKKLALAERDRLKGQLGEVTEQAAFHQRNRQAVIEDNDILGQREVQIRREKDAILEGQGVLEEEKLELARQRDAALDEKRVAKGERDAAVLEKNQMQRERDDARAGLIANEFQNRWVEVEREKNQHLARIMAAYDRVPGAERDENIDKEVETLSRLMQEKQEVGKTVEEAIAALPGDHKSRPALERLRVILRMEKTSLGNISHAFSLHTPLKTLINALGRSA